MLRIKYEHINFVWVSDHYDIHLSGLCRMNGQLMRFEIPKNSKWCGGPWHIPRFHIYKLNPIEKLCLLLKKRLFEICIGKHWTYPDRKQGVRSKIRKPLWFWRLVFKLYYLRR